MNSKLKVGIAGYGIVGKRRREWIDRNQNFLTVAVCDRNKEQLANLSGNTAVYSDYVDMINKEDLDVLFVALTNDAAAHATELGLGKGMHVFCEKPPARSPEELCNIEKILDASPNLKLKYGFNHRYHDSVKEALQIVQSGRLGKVLSMRGVYGKSVLVRFANEWRSDRSVAGGGILLDQGIHMADLMRLFGGNIQEVKSFVSNSYWNFDVEDNAFALILFQSGVIGQLHSSATEWRHQFNLQINLTGGALVLEGILSGTKSYGQEILRIFDSKTEAFGNPREERVNYLEDNSWRDEINEFADCIVNDRVITTGSIADGRKTLELVYSIYKADSSWASRYGIV
ncbi:oxidoreductase [Leptospira perolatii]|uniref:Oxidoreductase n=1 Tax=Leptospira perolatii TaxID=2023191 RepID=A0A2M9ZL66_9LEPT|nr:Gfo/Idh/MocA family oxidoreductase [Leptospira perolatii]PJZ70308.1 oxidoreductase [Leptospira perolatii]PJZ72808.1 oxidoreductase [Leptospira perolatii]